MKNYEYVLKGLDNLIEFIKKNDVILDCDECKKYGFECGSCNLQNTIDYLLMDRAIENTPEGEVLTEEFNKLIKKIREISRINYIVLYTSVNYTRNYMKELENNNIVFNDNQKMLLAKEFTTINSAIEHLESLREFINKYKK